MNAIYPKARVVTEQNLEEHLNGLIESNDVILAQGAGSISNIINQLVQRDKHYD